MLSSFTISQVSEADLRYKYCCVAMSLYEMSVACITLKTRGKFTLVLKHMVTYAGLLGHTYLYMRKQAMDETMKQNHTLTKKPNSDLKNMNKTIKSQGLYK